MISHLNGDAGSIFRIAAYVGLADRRQILDISDWGWERRRVNPSYRSASLEHLFHFACRYPRAVITALAAIWLLSAVGGLAVHNLRSAPPSAPRAKAAAVGSAADLTLAHLRPLSDEAAVRENVHIPMYAGPNPAAAPFMGASQHSEAFEKSLDCLTSAIYYEAGSEGGDGQRAVAQVVLNRVRHPDFPNSVCGVVYQGHARATGCQFTFTCDGSLARLPAPRAWARAREVAKQALRGEVFAPVGYATHYHANYVVPYWSTSLLKNAQIGSHLFYLLPGSAGRPKAFTATYLALEPEFGKSIYGSHAADSTSEPVSHRDPEFTSLGALVPPVADVSIERAQELDDYELLKYRSSTVAAKGASNGETDDGLSKSLCTAVTVIAACKNRSMSVDRLASESMPRETQFDRS